MDAPNDPLLAALCHSGQLTPEQCAAAGRIWAEAAGDSAKLGEMLRASDLITVYQSRKFQIGRAGDLLFGKYLIFDKIGEGGMGKVYRAADTNLARLVALKVVRPTLLANKTVLKRYKREAQATATLDHPNIVHLYDADEANGRHYMAMEYVDGSDLARLVKEHGPLGSAEACEYIRQAALGLHHAHEKGFVHRDIKPSNLLVYGERAGSGGKAVLKILDMGLVRSLSEEDESESLMNLTRDNTVVGTPDFMSPEQASDSRSVDGRSDLYSLGCAMFYLFMGKAPYREPNTIAKLLAHQRDPIPHLRELRPDIPGEVADIVAKLMAKKRPDRFQNGEELAAALMPFTAEGNRRAIQAPAAMQPRAAKVVGRGTATPVKPLPAAAPVETVQEIARPNFDLQSSPSISVEEEVERPRSSVRRRGFPLWLGVLLGALCIALPAGALAILSRSKPTEPTPPPAPKRSAPTAKPAEPPKPQFRPLRELLPSDTAAVFMYHARPYWDAEAPNLLKATRATLDSLNKLYGFDPRWFERGLVAFQPNPAKFVASGEAASLQGDWLAEFEKAKGRVVAPPDAFGIRTVRYTRVNLFIPKQDKVVGAILPPAQNIGGILVSDATDELNALLNHLTAKVPPENIAEPLLERSAKHARMQPLAFFAASGAFEVPRRAEGDPTTLAEHGIDLFTATFQFEGKWTIEIEVEGADEKKLKSFLDTVLPKSFEGATPQTTALAARLKALAKRAVASSEGNGKHLKMTMVLETATMNALMESLLK
jgi:serine/threonine-protein kinase